MGSLRSRTAPSRNNNARARLPTKTAPTSSITSSKRVWNTRPPGPGLVRTPTTREKRPKAISAARPASLRAPTTSIRLFLAAAAATASDDTMRSCLYFLDLRPAENAGRQEDQHDHQN